MRFFILISVAIFFLRSSNVQGQQKQLDVYLDNVYRDHVMPGFSVIVVKKDKVVYSGNFGVEKAGQSKRFTGQTVCGIGSLTKSFTALAMMQLAEEKKLDLNKPVVAYLPWFRTANPEWSSEITLRMLLNNTSGLAGGVVSENDFSDESLENMVRSLTGIFLTREPGTSYEYSNTGFSVAGLIVSKVSGMTYATYVERNIFSPLEMFSTSTDPALFEGLHAIEGHGFGIRSLGSMFRRAL
jgi:CubicO group peptidase (beta-lactamase class C family)